MSIKLPPLTIESAQGPYEVRFERSVDAVVSAVSGLRNFVVVADRNLERLYGDSLRPLLVEYPALFVDAVEEKKNPDGVIDIWNFFLASNCTRQTDVVVFGGGITQDLVQFAAHNFHRGLRWHFVPTTLLGMADSCIGAKCGINLGFYKNQLGVFHSPTSVWVCEEFCRTLSDTDVRSGYGEILKLHLTRSGPELFADLEHAIEHDGFRNTHLPLFIRRSLEVKKGVIEEDEYERDLRRVLNYGHTFGHALEAITQHAIPHGLAVAWGMDIVNFIAWQTGKISVDHFERVHNFICRHFRWRLENSVDPVKLIDATRRDKKNRNGKLTLVLPRTLGTLLIEQHEYDADLTCLVTEYLRSFNVCACN